MVAEKRAGFDEAAKAILGGRATPHALCAIISTEGQRDGYALRPLIWEGPGTYQHVSYEDGRSGFVRLPDSAGSLPKRPTGARANRVLA